MEKDSIIYQDLMKDLYAIVEVTPVDMTSKEYKNLEVKDRVVKARELLLDKAKEVANNDVAVLESAGIRTKDLTVWIHGFVEIQTNKADQILIAAKAKDLELGIDTAYSLLGTINFNDNEVTVSSDYYWNGEIAVDDKRATDLIEILDSTVVELLAPNDRVEKILGRRAMQDKIKE
jgi:hypothetical protein